MTVNDLPVPAPPAPPKATSSAASPTARHVAPVPEPVLDLRDEVLSREEAIAFLRSSETMFASWPIPVVRLDSRPRYLRSTLLKFAKDREEPA